MYTLFNEANSRDDKNIRHPRFETVKRQHRANLERVISYYRGSNFAVKSDHLLVKLIQSLPVNINQELYMYRSKVEDYADDLTMALKLTSPVSIGRSFFPGVFYGVDSEEIVVITTEDFDLAEVERNWENLSPLRFLSHPKTDLNLAVPMGSSTSREEGPSVVLLNLPMLACQYRMWRLREAEINPEFQRTTMQYVAAYPLPNSLTSQQDISYLNLIINIFRGGEGSPAKDQHPFYLNARHEETVEGIKKLLDDSLRRKLNFSEIVNTLEMINAESIQQAIAIPKMPFTRQVVSPFILARLPLIAFLLDWQKRIGYNRSRQDVNRIRRSILQINSDRVLSQIGTSSLIDDMKDFINSEIEPYL